MSQFQLNPLLNVDSYKHSHFVQYPAGARSLSSYVEARKDNSDLNITEVVLFGLQAWIKDYLRTKVTHEHVDEAVAILKLHGVPFSEKGFRKLVDDHGGYWPVVIRAVPEGLPVPLDNVLASIEVIDDPDLFWVGSFLETQMLRACWFGSTVATISRHTKSIIHEYLDATSDNPLDEILFKLHDFGARGASSTETSAIAGAAHLINFFGTDTLAGMQYAHQFYKAPYEGLGYSIPAAEHSTITSWGRQGEQEAYANMIQMFGDGLFAVVSDSYDIYNAVKNLWGDALRDKVLGCAGTLVVRPDSGEPVEVVTTVVSLLADKFGYTVNGKGFKVLNKVRVIQGDGVNPHSIQQILAALKIMQFSAENVAFGMGGALHQKVDRDTFSFAMKASAIQIDDAWFDVYKDPAAGGKTSKRGQLALVRDSNGKPTTIRREHQMGREDLLEVVYDEGVLVRDMPFSAVRRNANQIALRPELAAAV